MRRGPSVHSSAARTARPEIDFPQRQPVGGQLVKVGVGNQFDLRRRRSVRLVVYDQHFIVRYSEPVDLSGKVERRTLAVGARNDGGDRNLCNAVRAEQRCKPRRGENSQRFADDAGARLLRSGPRRASRRRPWRFARARPAATAGRCCNNACVSVPRRKRFSALPDSGEGPSICRSGVAFCRTSPARLRHPGHKVRAATARAERKASARPERDALRSRAFLAVRPLLFFFARFSGFAVCSVSRAPTRCVRRRGRFRSGPASTRPGSDHTSSLGARHACLRSPRHRGDRARASSRRRAGDCALHGRARPCSRAPCRRQRRAIVPLTRPDDRFRHAVRTSEVRELDEARPLSCRRKPSCTYREGRRSALRGPWRHARS